MKIKYLNEELREWVLNFVKESNAIEGIYREPSQEEIRATIDFLNLDIVQVDDLLRYVKICQPNAVLRNKVGLNVRVGNHFPLPGSPEIEKRLCELLVFLNDGGEESSPQSLHSNPFQFHCEYETLHPFTDCNGRSGRVLWLWQMIARCKYLAPNGFLQTWYYQSLSEVQKNDQAK